MELVRPALSLSKNRRDEVAYRFRMEDAMYDVTFDQLGDRGYWILTLTRVEVEGGFLGFGGTHTMRSTANTAPPKEPRHGYASQVYGLMFEGLGKFLAWRKPEEVRFVASADKQVPTYREKLGAMDLKRLGYEWRNAGSKFEIRKLGGFSRMGSL